LTSTSTSLSCGITKCHKESLSTDSFSTRFTQHSILGHRHHTAQHARLMAQRHTFNICRCISPTTSWLPKVIVATSLPELRARLSQRRCHHSRFETFQACVNPFETFQACVNPFET
jgi:hypothetical protein